MRITKPFRFTTFCTGVLTVIMITVAGCASHLPLEISQPPANNPTLADARQSPKELAQQAVRWGGTIARIENQPNQTTLEIVSRKLDSQGRPMEDDFTDGRFIAVIEQFLDPVIYSPGRVVTVSGKLAGVIDGKIDQHAYQYPVVRAGLIHLWEEYLEIQQVYPAGYWPYHDPFWDLYWQRRMFWGPGWY